MSRHQKGETEKKTFEEKWHRFLWAGILSFSQSAILRECKVLNPTFAAIGAMLHVIIVFITVWMVVQAVVEATSQNNGKADFQPHVAPKPLNGF